MSLFGVEEKPDFVKEYEKSLEQNNSRYFDVEELVDLVDYYVTSEEVDKALPVLDLAEKLHPNDTTWILHKSRIYMLLNKLDKAYDILQNVADKSDEMFGLLSIQLLLKRGRLTEAKTLGNKYYLEQREKENSQEHRGFVAYQIALVFFNDEIYDYAELWFRKATFPNTNALMNYAYCCEKTGNIRKAVEIYELYKAGNIVALINLGVLYLQQKKYFKAYQIFQEAVNREPYNNFAWFNLGILQLEVKKYEDALESFDFAIAIDDTDELALFNKAHTLYQLEKWTEAKNIYSELLNSTKLESWKVNFCLAECWENLQEYKKALSHYFEAEKENPNHYPILVGIAYSYLGLEDFEKTITYAKKALIIDTQQSDGWEYLGEALLFLNKVDEAILAYKRAVKIDPTDKSLLFTLATLYLEKKNYNEAKKYFLLAYQYDDTIADIEVMLAVSCFYLEEYSEMLSYLHLAENRNLDAPKHFLELCPEAEKILNK